MKRLEVHEAYSATCEDCGRDFLVLPRIIPYSEIEDFQDQSNKEFIEFLNSMGQGFFIEPPETITCTYCGSIFETIAPYEGDESDW